MANENSLVGWYYVHEFYRDHDIYEPSFNYIPAEDGPFVYEIISKVSDRIYLARESNWDTTNQRKVFIVVPMSEQEVNSYEVDRGDFILFETPEHLFASKEQAESYANNLGAIRAEIQTKQEYDNRKRKKSYYATTETVFGSPELN
jgi:hypothetical protein